MNDSHPRRTPDAATSRQARAAQPSRPVRRRRREARRWRDGLACCVIVLGLLAAAVWVRAAVHRPAVDPTPYPSTGP